MISEAILLDFTCSVCRIEFDAFEHSPYVLKCGHNLCLTVCNRLGDGQYYRTKSIKCPVCAKTNEYDFDTRQNKFEELSKNYSLISIISKLKTLTCTRWKGQLSENLIKKVESLSPILNKINKWPEQFKKQLISEEASEFYSQELSWDSIEEKRTTFLASKQVQIKKVQEIENHLKQLLELI